jgi:hypothetical protein
MKQSKLRWVVFALMAALPLSCKDEAPCDEGQESIGTGCFPKASSGGSGGKTSEPSAGEASGGAPMGNPDATFGTPCESDADCGGDAPVCDYKMFHYCLQIECGEGEANEGVCPEGWMCVNFPPNPTACLRQ